MVRSNLDTLQQKKLAAATPNEAATYDQQIQDLLADNINTGTLTYDEAQKELVDAQKTAVKYEIYADTSTKEEDSTLLKELRDPAGKYSYLDPKTRLDMIEESQRRIFQNNQTYKREAEISKNARFENIFQKANEGTLTLTGLDAEMDAAQKGLPGALEQKEIRYIRKSLQSRIKTDLQTIVESSDKAKNYLEFVDTFISDETDRQKGREAIVQAFKDGILSSQEAAFLNSLKRETEEIKWEREFKPNRLICVAQCP